VIGRQLYIVCSCVYMQCSKDDCDWSFATMYKLRRHEETHEGKKQFVVRDNLFKHYVFIMYDHCV